jgi:hypothetical protein
MEIFDNILSPSLFSKLEDNVMSGRFPWYYNRTTFPGQPDENLFLRSWSHVALNASEDYRSVMYNDLETIILSALDNANQQFEKIFRVRLNCNTITDNPYESMAHVDGHLPHKTALIYLNDSDGATNIYKELYDSSLGIPVPEYHKHVKLTLANAVTPKRNRMVCFNGLHLHSGTTPTKTARRILININYL